MQISQSTGPSEETQNTSSDTQRKSLIPYKKLQYVFEGVQGNENELLVLYEQTISKLYVDLRQEIESSIAIHILLKPEKSKQEQIFIKNSIQNLQLFEKNKELLNSGFNYHMFTQMKVEFLPKYHPLFHYGDFGQKYYIVLKGRVDLLMPLSECIEQNNELLQQHQHAIPYFQRGVMRSDPNEGFDQFLAHSYPRMGYIKTFEPGEAFGEIALITNSHRTGSIIARENSFFLVITKQAFHEILGKFHDLMQLQKLNFLQQFFFLKDVPNAKMLSLIQFMKIYKYKRNNVLFDEKHLTNGIYFIKEGEISFSTSIPNQSDISERTSLMRYGGKTKSSQKVVIKSSNQFFGEEEMILGHLKRKSKAVCVSENCEVYLLTKDILSTHCKQFNVMSILKENYESKSVWEEERNAKIQNIQKQNEENIHLLHQKSKQKSYKQQSTAPNSHEYFPSNHSIATHEDIQSQGEISSRSSYYSRQLFSSKSLEIFSNMNGAQTTIDNDSPISLKNIRQTHKRKLSQFVNKDPLEDKNSNEENQQGLLKRSASSTQCSFKIHSIPKISISETFRYKDENSPSIDKDCFSFTNQEIANKIKQGTQAKQEIFSKINGKAKPIQPMEAFADICHSARASKIKKDGFHKTSSEKSLKQKYPSSIPSSPSLDNQFSLIIKSSELNVDGNSLTSQSRRNSQFSQTQTYLPQSQQAKPITRRYSSNLTNSLYESQSFSNYQTQDSDNQNYFNSSSQPQQIQTQRGQPSAHLDILFEEDGENSPKKRQMKQNNEFIDEKMKLLTQKFQYGKNVAQFIRRKSQGERVLPSLPSFSSTVTQFDQTQNIKSFTSFMNTEQTSLKELDQHPNSIKPLIPDNGRLKEMPLKKTVNLQFHSPQIKSSKKNN